LALLKERRFIAATAKIGRALHADQNSSVLNRDR
jgi:hypothetical protein